MCIVTPIVRASAVTQYAVAPVPADVRAGMLSRLADGNIDPRIGNRWQRTRDSVQARGGGYAPTDTSDASGWNAVELAGLSPTPAGDLASLALAGRDAARGDWAGAGLNMLGVLPFVPAMGGVIRDALHRGGVRGAENLRGGFWTRDPVEAAGYARKAGASGEVARMEGVAGDTLGVSHPLTAAQVSRVLKELEETLGRGAADALARAAVPAGISERGHATRRAGKIPGRADG